MLYDKSKAAKLFATVLLSLIAFAAQAMDTGLIGQLTGSLGVSEPQATGGAGSIFKYAKQKMSPSDFTQVADAVPGIDSMMAAAPANGESSGLAAGAASMLGGSGGSIGGLTSLAGSFSKLGMDSNMISKFVPVILDYVKSTGGDSVMQLLKGALI